MTQSACFVVSVAVVLSGCQRDISGKYLAKYSDGICWLQLVRTPDDHLTAQMETDQLRPDGKIDRNVLGLTGASNGNSVTLSASALGVPVVTLAGSIEGGNLTLTGLQPAPLILARSDMNEYRRELNSLNSRSQTMISVLKARQKTLLADVTAEKFVQSADETLQNAELWIANANLHIQRLPGVEDRYRRIEAQMETLLQKERVTPNSVSRGQISVAVNQLDVAGSQLDVQSTPVWNEVLTEGTNLGDHFEGLMQSCSPNREAELSNRGASRKGIDIWRNACTRLTSGKTAFDPVFRSITEKHGEFMSLQRDTQRRRQVLALQSNRLE